MDWKLGKVQNIIRINSRVKVFRISPYIKPKKIIPGQHYDIRLTAEDGYQAQRSYSVSSSPLNSNIIEFTICKSEDGEVSEYLHENIRIGDQIEIKGPIGNYFNWVSESHDNIVFFAGGTGISPFMSMIRDKREKKEKSKFTLVYSTRKITDILFKDELKEYEASDPFFEMIINLTREDKQNWDGKIGILSKKDIGKIVKISSNNCLYFVCGPTKFVENISNTILDLGIKYELIKTERFG